MTRFGHKLNYVINTFVKRTPDWSIPGDTMYPGDAFSCTLPRFVYQPYQYIYRYLACGKQFDKKHNN